MDFASLFRGRIFGEELGVCLGENGNIDEIVGTTITARKQPGTNSNQGPAFLPFGYSDRDFLEPLSMGNQLAIPEFDKNIVRHEFRSSVRSAAISR